MEKVRRKRDSFLPPQDGQEWVMVEEGAELLGLSLEYFKKMTKEMEFTSYREAHPYAPRWYVRSEIVQWKELKDFRRNWLKRNRRQSKCPRYTEAIDEELARRIFIDTKEAAVILGVKAHTVTRLVRRGRLVSYQKKPGQRGSKLWFSRRAVEQLKEDEKRKRCQAAYQKGKESCTETGRHGHQLARTVRLKIPEDWLTTREAAERLGVHPQRLLEMRATGWIRGERLWRRYKPIRFWYFPVSEVERLLADEMYLAARAQWQARQKGEAENRRGFAAGEIPVQHGDLSLREMLETWKQPTEPIWACDRQPQW